MSKVSVQRPMSAEPRNETTTSRVVTVESLQNQARMLGMEITGVDLNGLLGRVSSGMSDIDKLDELAPHEHEPAVTFNPKPGAMIL